MSRLIRYVLVLTTVAWTDASSHAASTFVGPTHAVICYQLAGAAGNGDAIDICTRAIRHGELTQLDLAATYTNRGIAYARAGKFRHALRDYRRSLELNPDSVHTWLNLANLYARRGKTAEALESYQRAIELSQGSWALPYFNRALTLLGAGQRMRARRDLLRAIALEPHAIRYRDVLASTEFADSEAFAPGGASSVR